MTCALAHLGGCSGRLDRHHVVEQQWLKKRFPGGAVWDRARDRLVPLFREHHVPAGAVVPTSDLLDDPRNHVPLCRFHHEQVTNHRVLLEPSEAVWRFAHMVGLSSRLLKQAERAA